MSTARFATYLLALLVLAVCFGFAVTSFGLLGLAGYLGVGAITAAIALDVAYRWEGRR